MFRPPESRGVDGSPEGVHSAGMLGNLGHLQGTSAPALKEHALQVAGGAGSTMGVGVDVVGGIGECLRSGILPSVPKEEDHFRLRKRTNEVEMNSYMSVLPY